MLSDTNVEKWILKYNQLMLEVWETRSSGEKSLTGLEQKNIQYILFKKCTVQKTIRMIGGPNGAIKLCSAAAPVKRQVLPYFLIITSPFKSLKHIPILYNMWSDSKWEQLTLTNIYAPNNDDSNFFTSVFSHLADFKCNEIIIGGDFNLVLDVEKDKKGGLARTHKK